MNPLLEISGLPAYSAITPEHITPAIDQLLGRAQAEVERIVADTAAPTWENFVEPMDNATEALSRAWGVVGHLNSVLNSPALREAYNGNLPRLTAFYTDLGQNEGLFAKFKALKNSAEFEALTPTRRRILENELRDFVLSGAELPEAEKARFKAIQEEQSELTSTFSDHVLDATDAFTLYLENVSELDGVPADDIEAARLAAEADGKTGYKLTLQFPSYFPVLQYGNNRDLRAKLYRAYATRASELDDPARDNGPLMDKILALRSEEAQLLGYPHYAAVSLVSKMANSDEEVEGFLRDLAVRAKPFALKDRQELVQFAQAELGLDDLQAWDIAWASEKLRVSRYAFSEQEVKQYFPEDAVLKGLFGVIETLFGISLEPAEAPLWHSDVRYYRLRDSDGTEIGGVYMDLYARANKRGGAWMDDAVTRCVKQGSLQKPVAYLVCNFSAPMGGKPALFSHDEVQTLFHEMGHGLHHLLTEVDDRSVSGIHGVEWDAVELPSQFMENFAWDWSVLQGMTRHAETGKPLPRELYDKMIAAKNFQSGMQAVRQIEFSLFDWRIHTHFDSSKETVLDVVDQIRQQVAVNIPPAWNRFPHSFGHIFSGGYAAGYYSYKWAEVLSADAFARFEEEGVLNRDVGMLFRNAILAVGGSRPAAESFRAFRGRDPQLDALLRHSGMVDEIAA